MSARDERYLRCYRGALALLPRAFRRHHGDEMTALVGDRLRDAEASWWRCAILELVDVARIALRLRLPSFRVGDLRLSLPTALRALRRRPAFTALSALTLTLGVTVGMSTAAVIDSVLIRPLPHADPSRLVMVWRTIPRPAIVRGPTSYPDYLDWRAASRSFTDIAAYARTSFTVEQGGEPERVAGMRVSGNLFGMLGNRAALGRVLSEDDDRPSAEPVVVLSDALWRRRFGADSSMLGRVVAFGEQRLRIVGVMPPAFAFPPRGAELWSALRVDVARALRDQNRFTLIGRLAPGLDLDAAQQELEHVRIRVAALHPGINEGSGVRLESRTDFIVGSVRPLLLLLGLAAGLVLVMACVNLANLFLVRGVARQRETAVRYALGATAGTITREAVAEGLCIGAVSGIGGAVFATGITRLLVRFSPPIPRAGEIGVGLRVVLLGIVVATLAAAGAAALPLIRSGRSRLGEALASRGGVGPGARRLYASFVALQIAIALTLFVASGLLSRSFYRLVTMPRGFDGSHVLTGRLSLPRASYAANETILMFYDQLLARLSALPGVQVASGTWALPFSDDFASSAIVPADRPVPDKPKPVAVVPVWPGFFRATGVLLQRGRDFAATDNGNAPRVAIVNENLAHRFWPDGDAIGRSLRSADPSDGGTITIVGVVADIKSRGLDVPAEPEIYRPSAQELWSGDLYLTLRVDGDPLALAPAFRRVVAEADRRLPLTLVSTLDDLVDASIIGPRFRAMLISGFAALAGTMALIGVYGVLGFVVAQRKHEIAVRVALGATPERLVRDVLGHGMRIALAGIVLGLAGAVGVALTVRTMVFGITTFDPPTYAAAAIGLGCVTMLGCWLPARRAARIDPMAVLREDGSM